MPQFFPAESTEPVVLVTVKMEKEKKKLLTIKKLPYFVVILSQNGYHLTLRP